jgi:hypothetical protein
LIYLKHLQTLLRHKWFVFLEACRLKVPFLGAIHDLSKFTPAEFGPYARYFHGERTPRVRQEFDQACNLHRPRNRHHWQFWGHAYADGTTVAVRMPDRYMREMLADWRGAGRAYGNPDTLGWYMHEQGNIVLHADTRLRVVEILNRGR